MLLVVAGLLAGCWLLARVRRLDDEAPATPAERAALGAVTVVVPARDEAATLPTLLRSLAAQDVAHHVVVVDDGSRDGTAGVATALGAEVLPAEAPPEGWLGKPWACATGAAAAPEGVLVFLDADVALGPEALGRVLGVLARRGGLVSVAPRHRTARAYEQLSAGCGLVALLGTGTCRPGPWRPAAVAFGPCLATSTTAYRAAGGHAAVRGEVVEDVQLARAYVAAQQPVWCLAGGRQLGFRMYPGGLRSLVQGWSKNLAVGAGLGPRQPVVGAVVWVAGGLVAAAALLAGLVGWARGGGAPTTAAVLYALVALQWWWMLRRVGPLRWWTPPLFPVPLLAFVALFTRSALLRLLRRPATWRGRPVPVGRVRGPGVSGGR